jgi:hypothetical protein
VRAPPDIEDVGSLPFVLKDTPINLPGGGFRGRNLARSGLGLGLDDLSGLPQWVTVREASFLADVQPSIIEGWSTIGSIETTRLRLGRGAEIVLVRTEDLVRAPHAMPALTSPTDGSSPARESHPSRPALIRFVSVAAAIILLVEGYQLIHPPISSMPSRQDLAASEPNNPARPPGAAPMPTPTAGSSHAVVPDPSDGGGTNTGQGGSPGGDVTHVRTGPVRYIQQGSSVSAVVTLTNPNDGWWLPSSGMDFAALDDRGRVVATYQTTVTLGPGESKIEVAPALVLGPGVHTVGSVRVTLHPTGWRPAATFVSTGLAVSPVHVNPGDAGSTTITGRIANHGNRTENVQISCALTAGEQLAGVGVALLNDLSPGASSTFVASAPFVDGQPDAAACSAAPIG